MSTMGPITLNYETIAHMLHGGYGVTEALREDAERVLAKAKSIAPVVSGDYERSLHIEVHDGKKRLTYRVIADVVYAPKVERDHSVLAKARSASTGEKGKKKK